MSVILDVGLRAAAAASAERCRNELAEERSRALRPRLELRVVLRRDEERVNVGRKLDGLDQPLVGRSAADDKPSVLKLLAQRD